MGPAEGWRKELTVLFRHWKWAGTIALGLIMGGGGTAATVLGDDQRGAGESLLLVASVAAMALGGTLASTLLLAWMHAIRKDKRQATLPLPDPPPDPTFRCQAEVLDDGRVEITLRSSHAPSPLEDVILERRPRAFEASCEVELPERRGTSLTPTLAGCWVGKPIRWIYPDDFDSAATFHAPPFPLVTGHYAVKCSWRNPRGDRGKATVLKGAARCGFAISKTVPVTTPEGKRTALAMKVLSLALDAQEWFFSFPMATREADGDTPGERRLRAEREERVSNELTQLLDRQRELWPEIEAIGILAPNEYWEPRTLEEVDVWARQKLRGLVRALLRR